MQRLHEAGRKKKKKASASVLGVQGKLSSAKPVSMPMLTSSARTSVWFQISFSFKRMR